jgi:hypothetical protein
VVVDAFARKRLALGNLPAHFFFDRLTPVLLLYRIAQPRRGFFY